MNTLISKHLLVYHGVQPSEVDNMSFEEVIYFQEFEKEFRIQNNKMIAAELAKVISKMFGG